MREFDECRVRSEVGRQRGEIHNVRRAPREPTHLLVCRWRSSAPHKFIGDNQSLNLEILWAKSVARAILWSNNLAAGAPQTAARAEWNVRMRPMR